MPADSLSLNDKANRCVEILRIVSDYMPAMDVLNSCKPRTPLNLRASVQGTDSSLTCTLTWDASGDKGVTYQVVRKQGSIPQNPGDGYVITASLNDLKCVDTTLQPGIGYGYAVFAHRQSAFSAPTSVEVAKYSDLDRNKLQTYAENSVCRFNWVLPANCIGVRILRAVDAIPSAEPGPDCSVVASKAAASFIDSKVTNGRTYCYRLQCAYPYESGFRYSEGLTVTMRPEPLPDPLQNVKVKIEGVRVNITWTPNMNGGSVSICEAAPSVGSLIGQVLPLSDIHSAVGGKRSYASLAENAGNAAFDVPPNVTCHIAVISVLGSKGVISAFKQVSSVEKCEIDRANTQVLAGDRMSLKLKTIPKNLANIHYIVSRKAGDRPPWATIESARQNLMSVISVGDYRRDGMILLEHLPKDDLYVSVIGEYRLPDGTTLFSDPSKMRLSNRPKGMLRYNFRWTGGGRLFARQRTKHCTLTVTADRDETPEIFVVYKSDGHIPMSLKDPKRIILHTINEMQNGFPNHVYSYEFPDSVWAGIPSGTVLRLYINEDAMLEYEITPSDLESCKVP